MVSLLFTSCAKITPSEVEKRENNTQNKQLLADLVVPTEEAEIENIEEVEEIEKVLVVIDAGHQAKGNSDKEPIAPGSTTMKAKVSSGATGQFTGIPEHELNLAVALKLEALLVERGYDVIMIRDTAEVDISNAQRAQIANENQTDVFIRIHANGNNDSSVQGAFTICQTPENPYNGEWYEESRLLSEYVLTGFIEATGAKERSIWETDTMSGINWSSVPVTIIEMGYMSNQVEDEKMATEEYRDEMAEGMANGIDAYITNRDARRNE